MRENRPRLNLKPSAWIAMTGIALAIIYGALVVDDPILLRDDRHILSHLKSVSALRGYLSAGNFSAVAAFQPVTELTLRIPCHHLVNLALWILILGQIYRLMILISGKSERIAAWVAVIAVHPVFVGSVGWISARKHLLCCAFILAATELWMRSCAEEARAPRLARRAAMTAFYALSVLSHPIGVLWPAWAWIYARSRKLPGARIAAGLLPCLLLAAAGAFANYRYYSGMYVAHTTQLKLLWQHFSPAVQLLALGRYFFDFFVPVALAATYYPGSPWNLIGLAFFAAVGWAIFRSKTSPVWLVFFLFPLAPVLLLPTNVFVSDTYELIAAIGLALGLYSLRRGRDDRPALAILLLILVPVSALQARTWASDQALWQHALRFERSPRALGAYASLLLNQDPPAVGEARPLIDELARWSPDDPDLPFLEAKSTYLDPSLTREQKLNRLKAAPGAGRPWPSYYLAASFAGSGRYDDAYRALLAALAQPDSGREFDRELGVVAAEARFFCEQAQARDCDRIPTGLRSSDPEFWSEAAYQKRWSELHSAESPAAQH